MCDLYLTSPFSPMLDFPCKHTYIYILLYVIRYILDVRMYIICTSSNNEPFHYLRQIRKNPQKRSYKLKILGLYGKHADTPLFLNISADDRRFLFLDFSGKENIYITFDVRVIKDEIIYPVITLDVL